MDLGQSIRRGVKWLILGNTGQRALEFAFGVVLARLLVPADFGLIVTVQVFTGFVGMLTSGGMGQALIRAKEVDKEDFDAVFTLQLVVGVLIYAGFYLIAPHFAAFFGEPIYEELLRVSTLTFLLRPFANMHTSWLNREMDFKTRTLISMVTGLVNGISSILMAFAGLGVWSLVYAGLLGGVVRNVMLARATPLKLRLNFDTRIVRRHAGFGFKVVANDLLGHLRREGVKLVLSKLAGPAFLGLYNKADSLHRLPYWTLGQPLAQPLFRAMAKVQDNLDQTKYMYYRAVALLMVYVMPFFVGFLWVAEPFINFVYGPKWEAAGPPLAIMATAGFFYIITRPCGAVMLAQNRLGWQMIAQGATLVVTLVACVIGLRWGLEGAAWGWVASQVFAAAIHYWIIYRLLPTRLSDLGRALVPGLILNGLLVVTLLLMDLWLGPHEAAHPLLYMLGMASVGGLVYGAAFLLLPIPALATEVDRWTGLLNKAAERLLARR